MRLIIMYVMTIKTFANSIRFVCLFVSASKWVADATFKCCLLVLSC